MRMRSGGMSLTAWLSASTCMVITLRNSSRLRCGEHHVPAQRQVGAVELQHEAGVDDGAIFARHHVGERVEISLVSRIVLVLEITRDLSGRRRRHEALFAALAPAIARFARAMSASTRREILPGDRARARRSVLERRGEVGEHRRELGELGLAGAERRRARAVEAGEAILDVDGVVDAALLAVVDHVEAAVDLLSHHLGDRAARRAASSAAVLAAGRFCSASSNSTTCGGRGRLPVWVVRIRSVLRLHGVLPPVRARFCLALSARLGPEITSLAPLFAPDNKYVGSWAAVF